MAVNESENKNAPPKWVRLTYFAPGSTGGYSQKDKDEFRRERQKDRVEFERESRKERKEIEKEFRKKN